MPEEFIPMRFVCVGYSTGVNGGLIVGFAPIADDNKLGRVRWYAPKKGLKNRVVGGIYQIGATETQINIGSIEYTSTQWNDRTEIARWTLESENAETRDRIVKIEKRDRASDVITEALDPIIRLYRATDPLGRRALEALILDKIRRGI